MPEHRKPRPLKPRKRRIRNPEDNPTQVINDLIEEFWAVVEKYTALQAHYIKYPEAKVGDVHVPDIYYYNLVKQTERRKHLTLKMSIANRIAVQQSRFRTEAGVPKYKRRPLNPDTIQNQNLNTVPALTKEQDEFNLDNISVEEMEEIKQLQREALQSHITDNAPEELDMGKASEVTKLQFKLKQAKKQNNLAAIEECTKQLNTIDPGGKIWNEINPENTTYLPSMGRIDEKD